MKGMASTQMTPTTDREEDLLALIVEMEGEYKHEIDRTQFSWGVTTVIVSFLALIYGTIVGVNLCPK